MLKEPLHQRDIRLNMLIVFWRFRRVILIRRSEMPFSHLEKEANIFFGATQRKSQQQQNI